MSLLVTALGVRPRPGWCASRAAHVCELNDVFFLYVYVCDFFFTLYSKQINNYNLSFTCVFACECVCGCFHWHFCCFLFLFSWSTATCRFLPSRRRPKTGSLLVFVCGLFLFYFSTTILLGNWYRSTAVVELLFFCFCWFLPSRTKIEHLKLLHCVVCIVCFFFFQ